MEWYSRHFFLQYRDAVDVGISRYNVWLGTKHRLSTNLHWHFHISTVRNRNQTSPIKIFCNVRSSPSENVILYGPPATGVGEKVSIHLLHQHFVGFFLLFHEAVACTRFPESLFRKKVTSDCCCNTILSPQMEVRVTFASVFRRKEKHINNIKYLAFNI